MLLLIYVDALTKRLSIAASNLSGATIKLFYRNGRQIEVFKASDIDRSRKITASITTFPIRVNTAVCTKPMLDNVLVERVGACILFWRD